MNKRIKILYIASTLESGGITQVLFNTCKYIDYSRFKVYILTLSPEPINTQIERFKNIPVHLESLNLSRIEALFFLKNQLINKVKEINPDIIHTSTYRPSYYTFKYLSSYKKMLSLASNLEPNYQKTYGKLLGSYIAKKEFLAFQNADIKTVVSNTLANIYSQVPNIHVIQNGADEQLFFRPDSDLKSKLRKKLNLNLNSKIFLSIGALTPLKDPKTLVEAFLEKSQESNEILLILGDGPEMNDLKLKVENHAQIQLLGFKNNPQEYLQASDVFISCSHSEGLPNTVVEAASCGLYCILSDIPQHREIFDENSNQASFFSCSNVQELSQLMMENEPGFANNNFSLTAKKMTSSYMELYEK
jgi:glycosyltransferase involved in cell wall biosynthesis